MEEEELEMFDESIDRFEHTRCRPRRLCRPHGGTLRRREGLHVRARRTRAPPVYSSGSRTWTRQCRRSRLSSRRRSRSNSWICRCHRSCEYCGNLADHTTGVHAYALWTSLGSCSTSSWSPRRLTLVLLHLQFIDKCWTLLL